MLYEDLKKPEIECNDIRCPYHGNLRVHGKRFEGVVTSAKANKTAVVSWTVFRKLEKYDRYIKTRSKVLAHNPECISAKVNDKVVIYETRPISRWKKFVIVRKL